jgi:hypothetical protein
MSKSTGKYTPKRRWTPEEIDFIKNNISKSDRDISELLGASIIQIRNVRARNKIFRYKKMKVSGEFKECTICKKVLNLREFSICKRNKNGIAARCIECNRKYSNKLSYQENRKKYYQKNKRAITDYKNRWARTVGKETTTKTYHKKIEQLYPSYVRQKLRRIGFSSQVLDSTPDLIHLYKEVLKNKRLIKNTENEKIQETQESK